MTATPALGDGALVLEPLRVEHAAEMATVLSDAGLFSFTGGSPPSRVELEERYARQVAGPGDPAQEWLNWVVRLGGDGPAVGFVQATLGPEPGQAELAWVVGTPWQGRGTARAAAALVLEHLLSRGDVTRVVAHVHPAHVASQRVAAALGLAPTPLLVDGEVEWVREVGGRDLPPGRGVSSSPTPSGIAHDRFGPPGATPVVLLHAGVADRRMWDAQWGPLTDLRDAVRLDLRGFGGSDRPPPTGVLDPVADVLDTLDHLGVTACHLVGSSFGAGVAVEVALTRPSLVRSLLLAPPGGSLLTERTADFAAFAAAENEALARGDLDAAVQVNLDTWVAGEGRDLDAVDPALTASVGEMQRRAFDVDAAWTALDLDLDEAELRPAAVDRLADVTPPVLLVVGGRDLDTVRLAADALEAGLPRVRRVDLPDAAHLPSMEEPEVFLRLLLEWVSEQD